MWTLLLWNMDLLGWKGWDMVAAIGQVAGAIATAVAAWFALAQVKESKRQADEQRERAEKQEQEAKKALEPEMKVSVHLKDRKICILLTNMKPIPVYVNEFQMIHRPLEIGNIGSMNVKDDRIQTEVPELVPYGDVCVTELPLELLFDQIQWRESEEAMGDLSKEPSSIINSLFECCFTLTVKQRYIVSFYLETDLKERRTNTKKDLVQWKLYIAPGRIQRVEEIRRNEYLRWIGKQHLGIIHPN